MANGEGNSQTALALLDCVTNGEHRWEIVETLSEQALDIRDLSETVDVPRTTLRHNLDKLEANDVVEETTDRRYRLTSTGAATLEGMEQFEEFLETALHLEPLFDCIPRTEFDFEVSALREAELTKATTARPYRPSHKLVDCLEESESLVGVTPFLPPGAEAPLREMADGDDPSVDLTITDQLFDVVQTKFDTPVEQLVGPAGVTMRVIDCDVGYGALILDESVLLVGFDDNGKPHVAVETTAEACRNWVRKEYGRIKDRSTRIEPSRLRPDA